MASADLRDELTCSICTDIYTDPVTLPCAHSFCRLCIVGVLDTQDGSGAYTCPECRAESQERPGLEKNRKLGNIAESFRSSHPEQEEVGIPCTYCIQSPVPAAKTCLLCEASLCEDHLRVHSTSAEHVLTEPTASLEKRQCIADMKDKEYYCWEDEACICVSCGFAGEHRGHRVETLNEASKKKKKTLRNILKKLKSKREEAERKVQSLEKLRGQVQEKAAGVTERVAALIRDIREQLEALEKRVLSEISRQEEQISLRVSDLIRQQEIKKEELSRKMGDIEELCDMTDPITVLQEKESDRDDYCDAEEDTETHDIKVHDDAGDLDVGLISVTLLSDLAGIVTTIKTLRIVPRASDTLVNGNTTSGMLLGVNKVTDMLLDVNTAGERVSVSGDLKTASDGEINQGPRETPERFQYDQVLSSRSFSSGRHCWEVEGNGSGRWMVGVAYPSIARKGDQSKIGRNNKSSGLEISRKLFFQSVSVIHDSKETWIRRGISCQRLGIFLDYEAGRLSFYELCVPIRHLHTFTAAFTEPLHAVFGLCLSYVRVM